MPRVLFVQPDGARREVEAPVGISVMEAARQHGIAGVVAQCGGACACSTCHVVIDPAWYGRLEPPDDMEQGILENAWQPGPHSRLSCQIRLTPALDGLTVRVPERQSG